MSGRARAGWRHRTAGALACAVGMLVASRAGAAGRAIVAEPMQGEKVRVDGDLREWSTEMTDLAETLGGSGGSDPHASVTIGYDDAQLFVVLRTADRRIVRTAAAGAREDHATLYLAFPSGRGYSTYELELYPGKPGRMAGVVKLKGSVLRSAKIVEAPTDDGFSLEATLPWAAFAEADHVRVGLRAAVTYTDVDSPGKVSVVVGTSGARAGHALPPLLTQAEEGLEYSLLKPNGISSVPSREAYGNVAGDAWFERVAIFGKNLTIVGSHYREGKEFYVSDLGVRDGRMVTGLDLVDFDGDGHDEIVVRRRVGTEDRYREVLTVFKMGSDDAPFQIFAHETGIKTPDGRVQNRVSLKSGAIEIAQGESEGFDPESYAEPLPSDMPSALLPWQSAASVTFKWGGKGFERVGEAPSAFAPRGAAKARSGKHKRRAPGADEPPPPPAPRPPTSDEMLDRLYALYRKERGVGAGRPSFDFVTDMAGDRAPERVVIHGKDIVVFGKAFRGGTSYAFISIGVADPKDVLDVTARDLTGDGKAEIIVRAVLHAKASKQLGGGIVDRRALLIYGVQNDALVRLFGAETSRAVDSDQILGVVAFEPRGRGLSIELRPGHAIGWDQDSYPFPPDTTTAGGLEPLLLPWGEMKKRSYAWNGSAFVLE